MWSHVMKKEALMSIKGKQMVRYYHCYGNLSRGNRKKQDEHEPIPSVLELGES